MIFFFFLDVEEHYLIYTMVSIFFLSLRFFVKVFFFFLKKRDVNHNITIFFQFLSSL